MMDWKQILAGVAPVLAGTLGGPGAAIAVKMIAEHFGVAPTEEAVATVVKTASPDDLLKLKALDLDFARLDLSREQAYLGDVQNSRAMQVAALGQDDPLPRRFVYFFATGWSCFTAVYIFWITFATIPAANVRFADTILGVLLGTVIATLVNFFFGSSQGSVKSAQTLRDLARAK